MSKLEPFKLIDFEEETSPQPESGRAHKEGFSQTVSAGSLLDAGEFINTFRADLAQHGTRGDFSSQHFQLENTLLNSAERYADSIKVAADEYATKMLEEINHLNKLAEQRFLQAQQALDDAERKEADIIADAEEKSRQIIRDAEEKGYDEGFEKGIQKRYEEAEVYLKSVQKILEELSQYQKLFRFYIEKDGILLSLAIAKKILHQETRLNKTAVFKILTEKVSELQDRGHFRIILNPEDREFMINARGVLQKYLKQDQTVTLVAGKDVQSGDILIETDREFIDLRIENQLNELKQNFDERLMELEVQTINKPHSHQDSADASEVAKATIEGAASASTTASATEQTKGQFQEPIQDQNEAQVKEPATKHDAEQSLT